MKVKVYCDLPCNKKDKNGICGADVIALSAEDDALLTCDEFKNVPEEDDES